MLPLRKLITITLAVAALITLLAAYAYFVEPSRLVVNQYEMRVKGWNPDFDGFRVALVSDIHAGSNGADLDKLRLMVERINEQNVDAVFMLGDYVSRMPDGSEALRVEPSESVKAMSGLYAKHGVYVVLGNHDQAYAAEEITTELERAGYRVLDGELAEVKLNNGAKLRILGLQDHTTIGIWKNYSGNAKKLLADTEGTGDLIVLQHSPDIVPVITGELLISDDLKILFAGHTHGGQVWLPVLGAPVTPSMFGQKFAAGHVRDSDLDVFITTGIGTSILPFRFMVPPEIAVVTIRADEEKNPHAKNANHNE